ncbi:MAG: DUF5818 domain-containing protein [Sphingorhabdus sp.]
MLVVNGFLVRYGLCEVWPTRFRARLGCLPLPDVIGNIEVAKIDTIGSRVEETGTLIREGGGFALRRDIGGRWMLDMHRVPIDHIEKRVRITGVVVAERLVDVDALGPDVPAA